MANLFHIGRLNYDKAVRRYEHWTHELERNPKDAQALNAIKMLTSALKLNRKALYFEEAQ